MCYVFFLCFVIIHQVISQQPAVVIKDSFQPGFAEISESADFIAIQGTVTKMCPVKINVERGNIDQSFPLVNDQNQKVFVTGSMDVSSDQKYLAVPYTFGRLKAVKIFDLQRGVSIDQITLPSGVEKIHFVAFDPSNKQLLISYANKLSFSSEMVNAHIQPGMFAYDIGTWERSDDTILPEYQSLNAAHTIGEGYDLSNPRIRHIQDIESGKTISTLNFDHYSYRLYLSPQRRGGYIAHGDKLYEDTRSLRNLIVGGLTRETIKTKFDIASAAFDPSGCYAALNSDNQNGIQIYDLSSLKHMKMLKTALPSVGSRDALLWNKSVLIGYESLGKDTQISIYKNPIS